MPEDAENVGFFSQVLGRFRVSYAGMLIIVEEIDLDQVSYCTVSLPRLEVERNVSF